MKKIDLNDRVLSRALIVVNFYTLLTAAAVVGRKVYLMPPPTKINPRANIIEG